MRGKRLWRTIRLYSMLGAGKRTEYLRKCNCFASIGTDVCIEDRRIPLYSELIKIGNNVTIASHVLFVPHDVTFAIFNRYNEKRGQQSDVLEKIGCIEIGDNVFVGSNTTILYDVKIGNNVIIGAGSVVNHDIPDNSVAVGSPARVIGSFDDLLAKRMSEKTYPSRLKPANQIVSRDLIDWAWNDFREKRKSPVEKD